MLDAGHADSLGFRWQCWSDRLPYCWRCSNGHSPSYTFHGDWGPKSMDFLRWLPTQSRVVAPRARCALCDWRRSCWTPAYIPAVSLGVAGACASPHSRSLVAPTSIHWASTTAQYNGDWHWFRYVIIVYPPCRAFAQFQLIASQRHVRQAAVMCQLRCCCRCLCCCC